MPAQDSEPDTAVRGALKNRALIKKAPKARFSQNLTKCAALSCDISNIYPNWI
ncbi:hypothetical protein COO91_01389 [Nostoc flagelliforme CCNUN1]|uniref:Uncharacterized protein n=1 Tax=Nostoc flagelliforme CCNUN1 TaxID=2038116 RepID=A0A2K8SJ87_9NOSO|nr:hypothetical protein COO91_01389 [Nostoc flagelliforme CCNUN1]